MIEIIVIGVALFIAILVARSDNPSSVERPITPTRPLIISDQQVRNIAERQDELRHSGRMGCGGK